MPKQLVQDYLKTHRIFIWQGAWKGGAESVTLGIAEYLRDTFGATVVLGIFSGERRSDIDFEQREVKRVFPKRYVAYNNIAASLFFRSRIKDVDVIVSHTAGFWKMQKNQFFIYREPGDLRALLGSLSIKSKIGYFIPYLVARHSVRHSFPVVAASKRAEDFFESIGVRTYISSTNFLLEPVSISSTQYTQGEEFSLVFIGRDDKIKNLAWLERFCHQSSLPIHLHVLGVKKKNTDTVTYHGWVAQKEVDQLLSSKAHGLILPSLFEASPLVVLQALAMGLPVFVSKNAAPNELLEKLCVFEDASELDSLLSKTIDSYAKQKEAYQKRGLTVQKDFDKETVLKKEWSAIVEKILEEDPQTP